MIKQTFHRVEYTKDEQDKNAVDDLLWQRYCYSVGYFPNIGYPKVSPNFVNSASSKFGASSKDEESDFEEAYIEVDKRLMDTVEFCLFQLEPRFISAIEREMRNRHAKAQVWKVAIRATFPEALDAALIVFRKGGLV